MSMDLKKKQKKKIVIGSALNEGQKMLKVAKIACDVDQGFVTFTTQGDQL